MQLPRCKECGVLLGVDNMASGSITLCDTCFRKAKGETVKQCMICRKPLRNGERIVRQQVGIITPKGEFSPLEDLWYQHAKCRTESKRKYSFNKAKKKE